MKKMRTLFPLLILISLLGSSCTHSGDNTALDNAATVGDWRISFFQEDKDETSDFAGWTFNFAMDGTAKAIKASTVTNGTWVLSEGKFEIDFGADALLKHISDDWVIIEKTASSIKLKDDNTVKNELLQFIKI